MLATLHRGIQNAERHELKIPSGIVIADEGATLVSKKGSNREEAVFTYNSVDQCVAFKAILEASRSYMI